MKEMYEEITEVLKVLAHPIRLSLVEIMRKKALLMQQQCMEIYKCLKVQLVDIYSN